MNRSVLATFAAVVFFMFGAADATAQNWYAGGYGGFNYTHDGDTGGGGNATYDFGYAAGGFFGYAMGNGVRLEGEVGYRSNDVDTIGGVAVTAELDTLFFMFNGFYDLPTDSAFAPYIGGGLGVAEAEFSIGGQVYSDTVVAFQVGAGVLLEVSPGLQMSVDYRLFGTDDLDIGAGLGLGGVEYLNSAVLIGLRKYF